MEVVTAMESGMRPVGHIREMIVVTAMARTAADMAAIVGAAVETATSRCRRTIGGKSLLETPMGMTVEEAETDMETTVAEVAATIVMEAEAVAEEVAAATWRTGRSRPPGTRGLRWNSSALGRVAVAESTSTGMRTSRLKPTARNERVEMELFGTGEGGS